MNKSHGKTRLFHQFVLIIGIIIFIPILIISLGSLSSTSGEIRLIAIDVMEEIAGNILADLDDMTREISNLSLQFANDDMVRSFVALEPDAFPGKYDFVNYLAKDSTVRRIALGTHNIHSMTFIGDSGMHYVTDTFAGTTDSIFGSRDVLEKRMNLFNSMVPENGLLRIIVDELPVSEEGETDLFLCFVRRILSRNRLEPVGMVTIDIKTSDLKDLLQSKYNRNHLVWIVNHDMTILYHNDESVIGDPVTGHFPSVDFTGLNGSFRLGDKRTPKEFVYASSSGTGWKVIVSLPVSITDKPLAATRRLILFYGGLAFFLSMLIGYFFIDTITSPLKGLLDHLKATGMGKRSEYTSRIPNNEIGDLVHGYNSMNRQINDLIEKVYRTELNEKHAQLMRQKAEFQALQMQINPHFLYNTLSAVSAFAIEAHQYPIEEMINAMSRMLRYSVQNSFEFVELRDEIDHVNNFMIIQKYRSVESVTVEYSIDGHERRKILRLLLQPLVENACKHAFPDHAKKDKKIMIKAEISENSFMIIVKDNGTGFQKGGDLKQGIGLRNVTKRLQIAYGEGFGLEIHEPEGVEIRIIMPLETPSLPIKDI